MVENLNKKIESLAYSLGLFWLKNQTLNPQLQGFFVFKSPYTAMHSKFFITQGIFLHIFFRMSEKNEPWRFCVVYIAEEGLEPPTRGL